MAKIKGSNSKRKRKEEKAEEPEPEEELSSEEEDGDDQQPSDEDGDHSGSDQDEGVEEEGSDDGEEEVVAPPVTPAFKSDGRYHNKQRCLTLCSRGVTARFRHLMEDMRTLLPHCKKEAKLDPGKADNHGGGMAKAVNDIAEIRGCNTVLFLECRKRMDAYLWVGRTSSGSSPVGPSVKFEVSNIHTMDELRLTGNCMKGSRPILTFDESFGRIDHLRVIKELFTDIFGAPRGHPKTKPFVDRVMGFFYADGKIWVRNYQILEEAPATAKEAAEARKATGSDRPTSLVEIGPRFVLNPIRIFRGSFGGQTLYQNPEYVNPNLVRAEQRREKGFSYEKRKGSERMRKKRKEELVVPADPLDNVFK